MRKIVFAVAALALSGSAYAADMPLLKAPPMAVAPSTWTGFYIGGDVGGAFTRASSTVADPFNTFALIGGPFAPVAMSGRALGAAGGVHGGFNWQVAPSWLVGIEGDYNWADLGVTSLSAPLISTVTAANSFATSNLDVSSLASVRGRLGFIWDQFLIFGTGGVGWVKSQLNDQASCPNTGAGACVAPPGLARINVSNTQTGGVFGGGVEYKPASSNWIFGMEYLNYHFAGIAASAQTVNGVTGVVSPFNANCPGNGSCVNFTSSPSSISEVRARVSYKF
jgi:outer membrane immunogenic protein